MERCVGMAENDIGRWTESQQLFVSYIWVVSQALTD